MYEFGTVILLGLAVFTAVNLLRHLGETSRALRIFLDLAVGVGIAWATDYSMFAGWGIQFRSLWMGPAATGLVIGGLAAAYHDLFGLITSHARRSYGEATEIEARSRQAA
jgi:glutamate synthase domain-containing protein 1